MDKIIAAEGVGYTYQSKYQKTTALSGVTCDFERGKVYAIIGKSGSGKSTLLHLLSGLDRPTSGRLLYDGRDIYGLSDKKLSAFRRRRIGFIFQRYNLLAALNATDNVALPAVYAGAGRRERLARAKQLLANLGLGDKLENRPTELSGGQQQRVSIARALMNGGDIILAD